MDGTAAMLGTNSTVYSYTFANDQYQAIAKFPVSSTAAGQNSFSDMSADGRYVVFQSTAPNVVPGQVNSTSSGEANIFLLDRTTGEIRIICRGAGSNLTTAYGTSSNARISSNGTKIVYEFYSYDSFQSDILLYDVATGVSKLVSHKFNGASVAGNDNSQSPRISDNGRFIAFESFASDLVSGVSDALGNRDVFVYDDQTGNIKLVSHRFDSLTGPANGYSSVAEISGMVAELYSRRLLRIWLLHRPMIRMLPRISSYTKLAPVASR